MSDDRIDDTVRRLRQAANQIAAIDLRDRAVDRVRKEDGEVAYRERVCSALEGMKAIVPNGSQWVLDASRDLIAGKGSALKVVEELVHTIDLCCPNAPLILKGVSDLDINARRVLGKVKLPLPGLTGEETGT